jgi:2,3,4,5-tetrahydropyridine-2-carboxylate N-succinyltransferase
MLQEQIEALFDARRDNFSDEERRLFQAFKDALNAGMIRAAEPDASAPTGWRVNAWVKKGILLGFRMGSIVDMSVDAERQPFFDKSTYPVKALGADAGVRIVPGGSSIRDGSYVGRGVVCMPPMYVNVGAYLDDGTLVDSNALVGSCAQIGRNCHISAGAQIGGVLEPVGALPVIIEDEVLVGGNCGVYEGTVVKKRTVLGSGTILNRSTPVYDTVTGAIHAASEERPLVIPENAVVVAGSRPIQRGRGKDWQLSLYTPVIVKYRDAGTDSRVLLEEFLR